MIIDDFKVKFPELSAGVSDDIINSIIDEYRCYYNFGYDENYYKQSAILYLIAHLLYIKLHPELSNSPIKETLSQSVGSVSVSFSSLSKNQFEAFFNTTPYGQRFLLMRCPSAGAFLA
ncbi:MAG: DUF4054 domain-containing protein [Campylobacteraceae bacterium]|jgi:hypothetical protein|nr:DUF4054 domain-containing protein [Campylobacteraceae bacterium]